MRTKKLLRISILGEEEKKKEIVHKLQHLGTVHLEKPSRDEFEKDSSMEGVEEISELLLQFEYIDKRTDFDLTVNLKDLPPLKKTLTEATNFLDVHLQDIKEQDEVIQRINDEITATKANLSVLTDIPFPSIGAHEYLYKGTPTPENQHISTKTKETTDATYTVLRGDQKHVEDFIDEQPLKPITCFPPGTSKKEAIQNCQQEIGSLEQQKSAEKKALKKVLRGQITRFKYLYAALRNYYDQYTVTNNFQRTDNLFITNGYIEPKHLEGLRKELPNTNIYVEKPEEAPAKLNNKLLANSFQELTDMFDTPRYRAYDPTAIMTIFYPLFFGFMFSDIGYGLLLLLGAGTVRTLYPETKKYTDILGVSAIATILFGLLFGSFFGNLIPITPLYGDAFQQSFNILIAALILGIIHINIAILINLYQKIKSNESAERIILEILPIPLIETSLAAFYLGFNTFGFITLGFSVLFLLIDKKLFGIMDFTDFFGTWFSYARLLALSLATAGIALAVNIIAESTLSLGILGFVLAPIIIVVGHLFNFALNLLGCAINAARLHYVEFFGLFFEGGGTPFNAFKLRKQ